MNIMILVNKDFEYAGYRAGVDSRIRTNTTPSLHEIAYDPGIGPDKFHPSCMYKLRKHTVREYCISYLFPAGVNTSNSEIKHIMLRKLIEQENKNNKIDLIISVSTSESTPDLQYGQSSVNGCVFFGGKYFARNCRDKDSNSESNLQIAEQYYLDSGELNGLLQMIETKYEQLSEGMENVPKALGKLPRVVASPDHISLGVINVMDYSCYKEADKTTYEEYNNQQQSWYPVCLETTHFVVKMATKAAIEEAPDVLFVSPIVDRYGLFDVDVDGKWGGQNLTSSYNAGVAVANMLEYIIKP